jgi:hypothetical protein
MTMTPQEWKAEHHGIWQSFKGCDCPVAFIDQGKRRVLRPHERCQPNAVRCNGRLRVIQKRLAKLGPEPKKTPPRRMRSAA